MLKLDYIHKLSFIALQMLEKALTIAFPQKFTCFKSDHILLLSIAIRKLNSIFNLHRIGVIWLYDKCRRNKMYQH